MVDDAAAINDLLRQSYDRVPYAGVAYAQTHPARLAALMALRRLNPVPPSKARVLELGCAQGANLLPMAYALPGATFIGVDLSERQIEIARGVAADLGLQNTTWIAGDVGEATLEGPFDYIIAHGLYSWVPPSVRDALFPLAARLLSAQGLLFLSHNVLPGAGAVAIMRDVLRFRLRSVTDWARRAEVAQSYLESLRQRVGRVTSLNAFPSTYRSLLHEYGARLTEQGDPSLLLHDDLEEVMEPRLFHDVAVEAQAQGLRYLGDADPPVAHRTGLDREAANWIRQMAGGDPLAEEQHLDFVENRAFRQSLFVRDQPTPAPSGHADPDVLRPLWASTEALFDEAGSSFVTDDGVRMATRDRGAIAVLRALVKAGPRGARLSALFDAVEPPLSAAERAQLADSLAQAFVASRRLLSLGIEEPSYLGRAGDRPRASAFARGQLARGNARITNLRHQQLTLAPFEAALLPLLDGSRDRGALGEALLDLARRGKLTVEIGGRRLRAEAQLTSSLPAAIETALGALERYGLLHG